MSWDRAFRERAQAAKEQGGFVFVQLCKPEDAQSERVIVGTWESREAWETWHNQAAFVETRQQLEEIGEERDGSEW